jgi:phage gp36-like protein
MAYPAPYYAQQSDLNNRYDAANVQVMADPGNTGNSTVINARIALALQNADATINGFLRLSVKYSHLIDTTGIVDINGNVPLELTNVAVMLAGWWLLTARGTRDVDKDGKPLNHLYVDKMEAEAMLKQIAEGTHFLMNTVG